MTQKTPMQEMLEWVRATLPMDLDTPRLIEEKIESMFEKEKEFALNLWGQYEKECIIHNDYLGDHAYSISEVEWYDKTFNAEEK